MTMEHYRRTVGATHPTAEAAAMDTPAARIRREMAKHRPVNHNGVEIVDPAEALLAEAISTAEAINRDAAGRFAPSEPTPAPYRPATGTTGLAPATGQSQSGSVLDRIRASARRQYDNTLQPPDGFEPPAA